MRNTAPPRPASGLQRIVVIAVAVTIVTISAVAAAPRAAATEVEARVPLPAAFSDAYFGDRGVREPQVGILQPAETHFDVDVKAAFDSELIYFQYTFPTPLPSLFHGASVLRDGSWTRLGQPPVRGPQADGLYEDKLAIMIDDGSVQGFATQGGWLTCHDDVRGMVDGAPGPDIQAHPVLGEAGITSLPKYLVQSRDTGPEWWQFAGWHDLTPEGAEARQQRQKHDVFLDLWLWGSNRSNPVGLADDESVFEFRRSDPGPGPARANWDNQAQRPVFMFDERVAGFAALDWDRYEAGGYDSDDTVALIEGINTAPFDPERAWREGDMIPAQVLVPNPPPSRGSIAADGRLLRQPDGGWAWQVTLSRPLDTGQPGVDKVFRPGRVYDLAIAVHRLATGSRFHFVSMPFTVGLGTPGDVTAPRITSGTPDWEAIPATTITVVYPGQTTWQFITSDAHPGGAQVRANSMSVVGCHDEIGLGASNRAIETYLAGLAPYGQPEHVVARPAFEPGNVVIWFVALAILVLAGAVGIARYGRR